MTETGDAEHVIRARHEKLARLRELGIEPYGYRYEPTGTASEALKAFIDSGEEDGPRVKLAGRIRSLRPHGKTTFADLEDRSGRIQIYLRRDALGDADSELVELLDLGDWIGVEGEMFRTRSGEATLRAEGLELLSKTLRPLPYAKEHVDESGGAIVHGGFADIESRYRQRYADLAVHPEVRDIFVRRARVVSVMRDFLNSRGYLEVETPILQPIYGGATANPFKTFHKALETELYLRIADELYLKRLIVGGLERVYEIGKDFRNEGVDRTHFPEFTMLELYQAYADYSDMMELAEALIHQVVSACCESTEVKYQGQELDFTPPWARLSWCEALEQHAGLRLVDLKDEALRAAAIEAGVDDVKAKTRASALDGIFKAHVEHKLVSPTFIYDYPIELSPLAKRKRDGDSALAERFELFVNGTEIANAFSELNDPVEQRDRFEAQRRMQEEGFEEAHRIDKDFLRALEYGMPPTGGMGIGVDRLLMFITDQPSIRQVILFPTLRPE